jgi:hypothetical protein
MTRSDKWQSLAKLLASSVGWEVLEKEGSWCMVVISQAPVQLTGV